MDSLAHSGVFCLEGIFYYPVAFWQGCIYSVGMDVSFDLPLLKFDANGLIPAIVQDVASREVLMLAYMNEDALRKTLETKESWFWSRSRNTLWHKGETSGHIQHVKEICYDCDADTLLLLVAPAGPACHTGARSCFYRQVNGCVDV